MPALEFHLVGHLHHLVVGGTKLFDRLAVGDDADLSAATVVVNLSTLCRAGGSRINPIIQIGGGFRCCGRMSHPLPGSAQGLGVDS